MPQTRKSTPKSGMRSPTYKGSGICYWLVPTVLLSSFLHSLSFSISPSSLAWHPRREGGRGWREREQPWERQHRFVVNLRCLPRYIFPLSLRWPKSPPIRAGKITDKLILDQDQDQGLHFDLRSDQDQTNYVIFLPYEKIKIKIKIRSISDQAAKSDLISRSRSKK